MRYKILNLVRKLLRIPDYTPYIEQETHKIEMVRTEYVMPEQEYNLLTMEQLEYTIGTSLMDEIRKHQLFTIHVEHNPTPNYYSDGVSRVRVTAFVRIVNPKKS